MSSDTPQPKSLEELSALVEKVFEQNKKIQHRLTWMAALSTIRLCLIAIPIILAFIFLPPFIQDLIQQYQQLIHVGEGSVTPGFNPFQDIISQLSPEQIEQALKVLQYQSPQ